MSKQAILAKIRPILRERAKTIKLSERRIYSLPPEIPGIIEHPWFFWIAFATVEPHRDPTPIGSFTRGLIILNDLDLKLFIDDPERAYYDMVPGRSYMVESGRVLHGACLPDGSFNHPQFAQYGRKMFAGLLRDFHPDDDPGSHEAFVEQALVIANRWADYWLMGEY